MDLLILLVESRGQLVSRGDIVERLWSKDVFVDVETGINTAISKVRQALRDSTDAPAFVETVPGKGYRFIAAVEVVSTAPTPISVAPSDAGSRGSPPPRPGTANRARVAIGLAVVAMVAGVAAWTWLGEGAPVSRVTLAVLPFANIGSDPEREDLAAGLTEETGASLAEIDHEHLIVKGRTLRKAPLRQPSRSARSSRSTISWRAPFKPKAAACASPRRSFACEIRSMSGRSLTSAS